MDTDHADRPSRASPAPRRRSGCASSARRRRPPRARPRASSPATSSRSSTRSSAVFFVLDPLAGPLRRRGLRPDRDRQLLHRDPPGAEGEARPSTSWRSWSPPTPRWSATAPSSSCWPRRSCPATSSGSSPATSSSPTARSIASRGHDPGRVDADRRGRRGPQGGRRPGALGLLLHLRLGLLRGRRGARGELRRPARRRGARLPPPALAAAGRGQPGDRRLHLRDGAAGGDPAPHPERAQRRPGRGGADGDRRPGDADPRGPGAADERHLRRRRGAAGPHATRWSSR